MVFHHTGGPAAQHKAETQNLKEEKLEGIRGLLKTHPTAVKAYNGRKEEMGVSGRRWSHLLYTVPEQHEALKKMEVHPLGWQRQQFPCCVERCRCLCAPSTQVVAWILGCLQQEGIQSHLFSPFPFFSRSQQHWPCCQHLKQLLKMHHPASLKTSQTTALKSRAPLVS